MTSAELREKYLEFFRAKEHTVIPSASLIPENDPSVLFTTAGMHPLVPYLLGDVHPAGKRLASSQKCIRTGDIDEVGDTSHLTFFEMLGNWSLGDYFKDDAIRWSYEFLTDPKWLGLDHARLAVSVFAGDEDAPRDEESAAVWRRLGISESRITYLGKEDNWWPAGGKHPGPQGPDTEIFYWTGELPAPERFEPKDPQWVEIWNNVFMEFNRTPGSRHEPLAQKNVDTGMGLERTVAAVNGVEVFRTDSFAPLIKKLEKISGKRYPSAGEAGAEDGETTRAMRIIADHVRAATLILGDERGVLPSNTGQGYIVRRLIRRAVRYGRTLGLTDPFQASVASLVIGLLGGVYPELVLHKERIFEALTAEERKFATAIDRGLKELERNAKSYSGNVRQFELHATRIFDLYQTFGFPVEMSFEEWNRIRKEQGGTPIPSDIQKKFKALFDEEMKKHQELSRTASAGQFKGGLTDHSETVVRLHTATHLLNAALRKVLGPHVWQKGSNITPERTRFDFSHDVKMTDEEKRKVEDMVNKWISRDLTVDKKILPLEEARKLGAIGVFGEKYPDTVSIYTVEDSKTGEVISREFCGGPHVTHTGAIGKFTILKEEASSAGVRRIKAILE